MQTKDRRKISGYIGFAVLTLLYISSIVIIPRVSQSSEMLIIGNARLPMSAFAGVVSTMANICIILLVVFYRKTGFIAAMVLLLGQIPIWARNLIVTRQMGSLPGIFSTILTLIVIIEIRIWSRKVDQFQQEKVEQLVKENELSRNMFEQTTEALANAIDAKDRYTNGHSQRVAEYSRKIAREVGKSEEECNRIYYSALLHDVGKIGIPVAILNKPGKLTIEEFSQIKAHPVVGGQILYSIHQFPYLSIAARYHHERYDGKGYPEGLKGEDIPEIARIIAVADAYDAMSSNRSYRAALSQDRVREELVKGIGMQFDPGFARAMIHLIDLDTEYRMREKVSGGNLSSTPEIHCESIYNACTEGVPITERMVRLCLYSQPDEGFSEAEGLPTLIVFDALDGRVHPGEEHNKDLFYYEYARIRLDGRFEERGTRKMESTILARMEDAGRPANASGAGQRYDIEAVKYKDHALVRVTDADSTREFILALPDSSRFAYIAVTGEHCTVNGIHVENTETVVDPDYIPRIAEEVSYIRDCPAGDIPNVQVNGWRTEASEGIPIRDGMTLTFHAMSLPTARLVWHCPYISVFSSKDGQVNGEDFREYTLVRLDGENWESGERAENDISVNQTPEFAGWSAWKEKNRQGMDCTVSIQREADRIVIKTENLGIAIHSVTTIHDDVKNVYIALTGDQCALTNIRITDKGVIRDDSH